MVPLARRMLRAKLGQAGEVGRFGADSALVFAEGDVADVVAAVFDAPMLADGGADCGCGQADLRRIEGGLVGLIPEASLGVLAPRAPGDAGGGDDQAVPVGAETPLDVEGLDATMLLSAMPVLVDGLRAVGGLGDGRDRLEGVEQALLVGFDLSNEKASGLFRDFKSFFDSAWHRR